MPLHNANLTCWNCPAVDLAGKVDFRACGQSTNSKDIGSGCSNSDSYIMAECKRRPELGLFDPMSITFKECPQYKETPYGYLLKDMRVLILGLDGYLGWSLALHLGALGCQISGIDNYNRRDWVMERGAHSILPIARMTERLQAAEEALGITINFRKMDLLDRQNLKEFLDEIKPEAIVHYAECPSAPYSMIDVDHAVTVQQNNVIGTLGLLFLLRDICPQTTLLKLGTMGEYGTPLTGRPLFEGMFPADAVLQWRGREWSMGGELTPRDPSSFYHVSKVQDTFNIYEACKYWWLRSYDIMQGVIFGIHTAQTQTDPRLNTRFDIDEWFGTVVNRFVAQAVAGIPLTLYGSGEQKRGFIALEDSLQCMTRLICAPPELGEYAVVNQMSGYYTLRDLAETVARIAQKEFKLPVKIQRVENPRVEADRHPFEPIFERLQNDFSFTPSITLDNAIFQMLDILLSPEMKSRIVQKQHLIIPKTWWSGVKKKVESIEILEPSKMSNKNIPSNE